MSHILIIKDASGKELARVPVNRGYTIKEVPVAPAGPAPAAKGIFAGDNGGGKEKVG